MTFSSRGDDTKIGGVFLTEWVGKAELSRDTQVRRQCERYILLSDIDGLELYRDISLVQLAHRSHTL